MTISTKAELNALSVVVSDIRGMRDALATILVDTDKFGGNLTHENAVTSLLHMMEDKLSAADNSLYSLEYGAFCTHDPRYKKMQKPKSENMAVH